MPTLEGEEPIKALERMIWSLGEMIIGVRSGVLRIPPGMKAGAVLVPPGRKPLQASSIS